MTPSTPKASEFPMDIKPIKTNADYRNALSSIEDLMLVTTSPRFE